MTFADTKVASIPQRPTKKFFHTEADVERAILDKYICPDLMEYKREYRQQRRHLRRAMKKHQSAESTLQLTISEQQQVDEDKWIEVTKSRKISKLVSIEASPVQCSNRYEALAEATIKSPPLAAVGY